MQRLVNNQLVHMDVVYTLLPSKYTCDRGLLFPNPFKTSVTNSNHLNTEKFTLKITLKQETFLIEDSLVDIRIVNKLVTHLAQKTH